METGRESEGTRASTRGEPDLRDYLNVVMRRRWLLVATVALSLLASVVYVYTRTPIFRAVCRIELQPKRATVMKVEEVYDPTYGAATGGATMLRQFLETQYRLILSRPLLRKTYEEMGFAEMEEFRDAEDPIRGFAKCFSVTGVRNSFLADVAFEWKDKVLARDTVQCLVRHFKASKQALAQGLGEQGLEELKATAERLRPELEAKADELQNFIGKYNMISLEEDLNIVSQRLRDLSESHTAAQTRRIASESRYANILGALTTQRSPEEMPEVVDSQSIRDLKLEYIRTKLLCSDLENSLGPNHPQAKSAAATLATIAEKLELEVRSVLASAQAEYLRARKEEADLKAVMEEQDKRAKEFSTIRTKYKVLKDAYDRTGATYGEVRKRINEIEITMASSIRDDGILIAEPAEVPSKPFKPRKALALGMAGIFGVILGLGLCFFVDYLDTSVKSKEDIEELTGGPILGYVPSFANGYAADGKKYTGPLELLAVEHPRSASAEVFRSIRTALGFTRRGTGECCRFAVTSALPSEGKTLVSVNVALALARTGKKVLLVDADLRRPRVHKIFGFDHSPGLSNLFAADDEKTLEEVVRDAGQAGLSVVPSGPLPPNPAELLNSPRMGELIGEMGRHFDFVVFDTPPMVNVTDSAVLSQRVDGALLVVRTFATDRSAVVRARELLNGADVHLLGVVVNGADAPRTGYEYERYYYNYRYDYAEAGKKHVKRKRSGASPKNA